MPTVRAFAVYQLLLSLVLISQLTVVIANDGAAVIWNSYFGCRHFTVRLWIWF